MRVSHQRFPTAAAGGDDHLVAAYELLGGSDETPGCSQTSKLVAHVVRVQQAACLPVPAGVEVTGGETWVPQRRREHRAGRLAASLSLSALSGLSAPLPRHVTGKVLAPPGYSISIAHSTELAISCCVKAPYVTGVDIEPLDSAVFLERGAHLFTSQRERQFPALSVFSLKECLYKALAVTEPSRLAWFELDVAPILERRVPGVDWASWELAGHLITVLALTPTLTHLPAGWPYRV